MPKKDKTGIVYVAVNPSFHDDNLIKIGMTGDLKKRINSLSLPTPFPYECIKAVRVSNAKEVERALHNILRPYRYGRKGKREFFKPNEDVKEAILSLLDAWRSDPKFEDVTPIESDEVGTSQFLGSEKATFFNFARSKLKVANGRKWITAGSKIRKERTKSFKNQDSKRKSFLSKMVDDALKDGIISDDNDKYYSVVKDWEFKRAYIAATIVSGGWCSNRPWKEVKTKIDYTTWKQEMLKKK